MALTGRRTDRSRRVDCMRVSMGGGMHSPNEWFNPERRDLGLKRVLLLLAWALRT